jgi:signal transduction histidine kinase/DNA-binding response OmpR family regulator
VGELNHNVTESVKNMKLDPATLILVSVLTGVFLPFVLLGLSRSKETGAAVTVWTRATFIYATGLICLLMRNVIPDVISIALGNVLLFLGYAELYQGFRIFFGRVPRRSLQWVAALLYLVCLLVNLDGAQNFEIRVVLASAFLAAASGAIAIELLQAGIRFRKQSKVTPGNEHFVFFGFGVAFSVNTFFLIARGIFFFQKVTTDGNGGGNDLFYALSYLIAIFVHSLLAAGLPLLLSRRTQRELVSSEASLLKVQQVGRVAHAWLDTNTMVITGNDVFREVLGLPRDLEITLDVWLSMVHLDDLPRLRHAATVTQGGVYFSEGQEYRMLRYSDQQEIWIELSSQVLSDPMDGHPMLLSILRDITSLKQSELDAIRKKHEAEQSSQSKSQFLANMSHEIRTPINAILGMLALLQYTSLTSRQLDYVSKAVGATQGLLGLINDILDFSKVDAGKMSLECRPFSLDALLRNLAVVLSSNTKNKNIDVLFEIDAQLPTVLMGDALRLQQVLINLGGNAIKFTEAGQVIIALKMIVADEIGVTIEFSIQDSGIGIAPEHQKLIFEAFSQAEASTTRRFGGTGLGLAISRYLVELMGGTLLVESELDIGTTFRFRIAFPAPTETPEDLHAPDRSGFPMQRRVLIVDDNPSSGHLLQEIAHAQGWPSDWFGAGADALAKVQAQRLNSGEEFPYSLVLVDWQMPGMDGWEVVRQLRGVARQCVGAQPLVIMMSSNGRQDLALRSEDEQALVDGFMVKPVTSSMILDVVLEANTVRSGVRRLATRRSNKRQLAGMRILVVEDNLLNQQVAEELLSNEGALVSLAANGQLGVEAVQSATPQFDVVLMDIQMPVMDGYQATSVIRNRFGLDQLPIVAMTANAMVGDREACIAAGMNEHIGKPFDMAMLISLLIRSTGFLVPLEQDAQGFDSDRMQDNTLPEIAGVELSLALHRMSNSHALYRRAAQEFLRTLPTILEGVQNIGLAQETKTSTMTLHTLKGNAATLGLTELAVHAGRLEHMVAAGKEPDDWAQERNALERHLSRAGAQLEAAIEMLKTKVDESAHSDSDVQRAKPDSADRMRLLIELSALTDSSDMQALEFFAQHRASFEALPEGIWSSLETAMQELDFANAHQACLAAIGVLHATRPPTA